MLIGDELKNSTKAPETRSKKARDTSTKFRSRHMELYRFGTGSAKLWLATSFNVIAQPQKIQIVAGVEPPSLWLDVESRCYCNLERQP